MAVAFGKVHGDAESAPAGDDRDLVQRVVAGHEKAHKRVPRFVIGGQFPLFVGHHHRPALGAHHHLVLGFLELGHGDDAPRLARRQQRRLVHQIGEIGARKPGRAAGDDARLDIGRKRHLAHVHLEDFLAPQDVRVGHHDLPVEPSGPQQRRVEHVRAVGRGDENDAFGGIETVHLDEKLVQRLLAFVVASAEAGAAMAPDGVDLVDEHDARRVLAPLLEHVAHAARAHADEHFHEVGAGDREKGHVGLAGDGAREQGLARARRPHEEDALRDAPAEALELPRVPQEFDDLLEFFLRLVDARDVFEGDPPLFLRQQPGARLAEAHRLAAGPLHLQHEEYPHPDDEDHRQPVEQDGEERR